MYNQQPNNISPGAPHVGITQQAQRPSGVSCPVCDGFIPLSMQQLASALNFFCPHCGLRLTINQQQSKEAIDAVKKFLQAQADFDRRSRSM